jgi:hypothetical protein
MRPEHYHERTFPICGVRFGRSGPVVFADCQTIEPPPRLGDELVIALGDTLGRGRVVVAPDQVVLSELAALAAKVVRRAG